MATRHFRWLEFVKDFFELRKVQMTVANGNNQYVYVCIAVKGF